MKHALIIFLILLSGCASVEIRDVKPQIIEVPKTVYFLYKNTIQLQNAYATYTTKSRYNIRGFYTRNEIHCIEWDFECLGHEVYHLLRQKGNPRLDVDGVKHFNH